MSDATHEPINILKALEDDVPTLITKYEIEMQNLCSRLASLAREHSNYVILNMVKKELDRLPDD